MLTLESRYLTGSDRKSSGTRNDAYLLKNEQDNKDVKFYWAIVLSCSSCSLAKVQSLRIWAQLMQLFHHVSYFTVGCIQWSFTRFRTMAYIFLSLNTVAIQSLKLKGPAECQHKPSYTLKKANHLNPGQDWLLLPNLSGFWEHQFIKTTCRNNQPFNYKILKNGFFGERLWGITAVHWYYWGVRIFSFCFNL